MLLHVHVLNEETDTFLLMSTQLYLRKIICMTSYMLLIINSKLFLTALLTRHFWTFSSKVSGQHNDTETSFHFICFFFFNLFLYYAQRQVYYNIIKSDL